MKIETKDYLPGLLGGEEIALARKCMDTALAGGAQKVRITLNKSLLELVGMLDGAVDKVTHALDRSLQLALFVDGRFGTFSTNRLEGTELEAFIRSGIETVRMLAQDPCRDLPDPARVAKDAADGRELGLYDAAIEALTPGRRREMAEGTRLKNRLGAGWKVVSEEGEYSDSVFDSVVMDSQGLFARHTETSFEIGYEVTVESEAGDRYSAYWWDASPFLADIMPSLATCAETALARAVRQIGPEPHAGGRMNVVVESECASKLLNPLLAALGGYAVQQKNSFLADKLGQQVFPTHLTVMDMPRSPGKNGSHLFDSEGVATAETPIVEAGVVKMFFLNTYIAGKMGASPTVEDATRPVVLPTGGCKNLQEVLEKVGEGILVTGFNGGNSNSSTGDFSYGIEGFAFAGGRILHPVREMLMTGNFLQLWNNLTDVADDARACMSKLIPTLAFSNVDVNG